MIKEAGFKSVGLGASRLSGYDTREGRRKIKSLLSEKDLRIDSVHALFPEGDQLFSLDEQQRLESVRQCMTAVDASAYLHGGAVAAHLASVPLYSWRILSWYCSESF